MPAAARLHAWLPRLATAALTTAVAALAAFAIHCDSSSPRDVNYGTEVGADFTPPERSDSKIDVASGDAAAGGAAGEGGAAGAAGAGAGGVGGAGGAIAGAGGSVGGETGAGGTAETSSGGASGS